MKKYRIEFGEVRLGETARKNIFSTIDANWVSGGPKVLEFENKWNKLFNYGYSKAMSSGTDADINACMSLYRFGANRGDEIIVPSLAFIATANSILAAGFTPVFVDVEKHTLNINPNKIEEKITSKTRAIMVVHTMGKPCNMKPILEIAKQRSLFVIEDCCESHGAKYQDKFVGHWGDVSTFSFFVAHLITCGEGGMLSTNNKEIADMAECTRSHGRWGGQLYFDHSYVGFNSKMNDMEASLGLEGIENFWWTYNTRKNNLYKLMEYTKDLQEYAWFNIEESHENVCPHAFTITLKNPKFNCKLLSDFLDNHGIKVKRNFGSIPTQHKAFAWMGHEYGEFPESEYIGDNGIHFGVHQYLKDEDLAFASEVLHDYFKKV